MTVREAAIAQFRATMELEETLKSLVERVAALSPETVLIAWEVNGEVDVLTVPYSKMLAKGYADRLYDILWEPEEDNDADDSDDSLE